MHTTGFLSIVYSHSNQDSLEARHREEQNEWNRREPLQRNQAPHPTHYHLTFDKDSKIEQKGKRFAFSSNGARKTRYLNGKDKALIYKGQVRAN